MARAFKAFVRAKQVKPPAQLLRRGFVYCGVDNPLREVAGTCTALYASRTDQAVAERWRACGPWGQALLRQMVPRAPGTAGHAIRWPLPSGQRIHQILT